MKDYKLPTLKERNLPVANVPLEELEEKKVKIIKAFTEIDFKIEHIKVTLGPRVSLWEITPAGGQDVSIVEENKDWLLLHLYETGCRMICPIPVNGTIGIEIPNRYYEKLTLGALLSTKEFRNFDMELPLAIGQTVDGKPYIIDLVKAPHILIGGTFGGGQGMREHSMIASLLCSKTPEEVKMVFLDPKRVEFTDYGWITPFLAKIPDMEGPIATDIKDCVKTLNSLCTLMEHRYDLLRSTDSRNIKDYNEKVKNDMPYIVCFIDEFRDLIMTAGKEFELPLIRLAQMSRAVGIHIIMSTHRLTNSVMTSIIKANIPCRISGRVSNISESTAILDTSDAECLSEPGDTMVLNNGLQRVQGAYVDQKNDIAYICAQIMGQGLSVEEYLLPKPECEFVDPPTTENR